MSGAIDRRDILYVTHNGITDHIGQSQIAPYCLALAERGHRIHIVSAEKPGRDELTAKYRDLFDARGIGWSTVDYHNRPQVLAQLWDLVQMRLLADRVAGDERPRLVHCRSYLPIEIGVAIKKKFGARLLIDFRHFFVEAGLQDSRYKFVYRAFKSREAGYFRAADHVVTLTHQAAEILDRWYPSVAGLDRFTVIPCCADFDHFDMAKVDRGEVARRRAALGFGADDTVLLYLGSIGPVYLLDEMMALFRELRALRPTAKFLFVSNNGEDEVRRAADSAGVPADAIRFLNASRDEVPLYLAIADMSVMFFRPDLSLAGCSPTKMAELFAANIPIISNGGVGDLDQILAPDRNCSVTVDDFKPETLRAAVQQLLDVDQASRATIRANSGDFTLGAGVDKYDAIYRRLLGSEATTGGIDGAGSHDQQVDGTS